jgi:hypothetical protein
VKANILPHQGEFLKEISEEMLLLGEFSRVGGKFYGNVFFKESK